MTGKSKTRHSHMLQRQNKFNNNYSLREKKKQYDALEDQHASYYFVGRSVKKHMKILKKAVANDERNQIERQRLNTLISDKIRFKFPELSTANKVSIYSNEFQQLQWITKRSVSRNRFSPRRSSQLSINAGKPKKLIKLPDLTSANDSRELSSMERGLETQKSNPQQEEIESELVHKKQHNKFMRFLQTKRQNLRKKIQVSNSQLSLGRKEEIGQRKEQKPE